MCQILKYKKKLHLHIVICKALKIFEQNVTLSTKITGHLYIHIILISTLKILIFVDGVRRGISFI